MPQVWEHVYYSTASSLLIVLQDDMVADSSNYSPNSLNLLSRLTIEGATVARTRFVPYGTLTFSNDVTPALEVSPTSEIKTDRPASDFQASLVEWYVARFGQFFEFLVHLLHHGGL